MTSAFRFAPISVCAVRLWLFLERMGAHACAYIAFLLSWLNHRSGCIEEYWDGGYPLPVGGRIAVFVHYDRHGVVHDYVLYHLAELRRAGFAIVFVSNAPLLVPDALVALKGYCAVIARRRNLGYDFGAFKDGLTLIGDIEALDELLLVNDSVYGPFGDLSALLERTDAERAVVWGITDSWEHGYHLQSYFLLFKQRALRSQAFRRFWRSVRYVQSKTWVVRRYEIGLSRALIRDGLRCAALFPYRQAAAEIREAVRIGDLLTSPLLDHRHRDYLAVLCHAVDQGQPLNGSHYFWDYLIAEMGCPFLKRELLQKNPARVPFVHRWESVVASGSNYDPDLILRHLEGASRNRSV